jgi:hypothetical protein
MTETNEGIEAISVEAVVTRADGTVEDLGAVAEWHKDDPELNKGLIELFKEQEPSR